MGRSFPLFLARVASIFLAGMLLFAMVHHAHAENYDGYGLKPLGGPDAGDYGMKAMPGDPVPTNAGFAPVNAAPAYAAPAPAPAPAPYGYTASSNAGFAPVPQQAPAPYQPPVAQQQVAQGPFGYKAGDGMDDAMAARPGYLAQPAANGYYQTLNGAQQAAYQPSEAARMNPGYVLGPGDKIKLTVYGETDLSGDFTIDGTGLVALPLVGQLRAAGYSAAQLEQAVGSALSKGYLKSPRISVEVSTYRPFYIIGAVNRPGEYPYVNHMNALNAVALAGGYQNNAVESVVFIRREGSNREEQMPTDRTTAIYPGDVVRVHFTFLNDAMSIFSPLTGAAGIGIAAATVH
jgi:protein involved in polysaccharide export with SLBB domain